MPKPFQVPQVDDPETGKPYPNTHGEYYVLLYQNGSHRWSRYATPEERGYTQVKESDILQNGDTVWITDEPDPVDTPTGWIEDMDSYKGKRLPIEDTAKDEEGIIYLLDGWWFSPKWLYNPISR